MTSAGARRPTFLFGWGRRCLCILLVITFPAFVGPAAVVDVGALVHLLEVSGTLHDVVATVLVPVVEGSGFYMVWSRRLAFLTTMSAQSVSPAIVCDTGGQRGTGCNRIGSETGLHCPTGFSASLVSSDEMVPKSC